MCRVFLIMKIAVSFRVCNHFLVFGELFFKIKIISVDQF
jgi:hypothetical protein